MVACSFLPFLSFSFFLSLRPRYAAAFASCDWHAAIDGRGMVEVKMEMLPRRRGGDGVRRVEVRACWRERRDHRRRLFRFVMGKADTHRDAHLRLFIPRSTYNTSITGNIPERLARRGDPRLRLEEKKAQREKDLAESRSPGDATIRAWLEILRTVVILPLNASLSPRRFPLIRFFPFSPGTFLPLSFRCISTDSQAANDSFPSCPAIQTKTIMAECCQTRILSKLSWILF